MKKKIVVMLSLVLCLMLSISLAACNNNKHEAKTEWKFDNAQHWHECATKGHDDKLDEAAHTWNDGVVTTEPTETTDGVKTFTCTVCGATKTAPVEKLTHTHTFDTANWETSDTHHWHKATCSHTEEVKDKAAHTWNDGEITTAPTETAEGVKTFICTVCKITKTESVPKLTHTHTYATEWSKDAANHWYAATCEHTEEVKDKAAHTWNGGAVTTEPTYTADGVKTFTCTVCGATKTESVPKLSPKDNTITVGTIDFTYNAKSQPIDSLITADNKAEMVIKYVGVDGTEYAESTTAPTNAGTYQYTITIPATAEWKAAEASGKFTIAKYELTVLYEKTHTKEYDGNAMILVEYKSLDGTDVLIVIFMKSKDIGTEIDRIMLPGLLKDNYTYDQSKVKAEIVPKKLNGLEFSVNVSDIDEEGGETDIEREIDGVNGEKLTVIITFTQSELYNEGYLDLSTDGSLSGTCRISFKTETGNYVFERDGMKGIGELKLVEDVSGIVAEGDFVEGATVEAIKLKATDDNYTAAINKIDDKNYDKEKETAVFDISLVKDNVKVQPNGKVNMEKGEWKNGMVYVSADGKKNSNTMASPTQWAMVRRAAQHILYAFANSNDIKNGVADTTTINLKFAKGMTGIDMSIFGDAIGTTDISDITFTDASFNSENPTALPAGLTLSADGILSGNTNSLETGMNTVYLTYKYDGFATVKKAIININIVEQAELDLNGKLAVGQSLNAQISSVRYAVGQPMSAMIRGLAHGENETYGTATGTIENVTYSLAAGSSLPAGLTLSTDGKITGTPTQAGTYDIIVRITSEGVVHGGSFSGTEEATQSNFFKFTLTVGGANENGGVEFKGEVVDNVSVVLTRNLNGMDREYAFVINTELLKDEKAKNNDLVIGVARTVRTPVNTRRDFVAFLTLKADGTFEIENAKVALISGSDIEKIEGTWTIEGSTLTLTVKAGENYKGSVRVVAGAYTVPSDKQ